MVVGDQHRVYEGFSGGYGFDGLGVAMLAGSSPYALIPSALLFAIIGQGSDMLSSVGIPKGLNGILLGLLIIVFAVLFGLASVFAFYTRRNTSVHLK